MNILIVDDQSSVINGLLKNIPFQEIGFTCVFTATNTDEALDVFSQKKIHVLLADIEMPGRNGLELNSIVGKLYPDTLCIILTSHAKFSYAQESVRLHCFDYIVQPAPYEDIALSLKRAVETVQLNYNNRRISHYGNLFRNHKHEFMGIIIQKLYSNEPESLKDCIRLLKQAGYSVSMDSIAQLVVFDVFAYSLREKHYPSQKQILQVISHSLSLLPNINEQDYLVSLNPYRQFTVLFFAHREKETIASKEKISRIYRNLCQKLEPYPAACYYGKPFPFSGIQLVLNAAAEDIKNNVAKEPDLFFISGEDSVDASVDRLPCRHRLWEQLLHTGQKNLLRDEIFRFLDYNLSGASNRFEKLCDLHQQVVQIFFEHFYRNNVEIGNLFTADYTFQNCMDAFSSVDDFKKCVDFFVQCDPETAAPTVQPDYVEKAKIYISENSGQMISVKEVAEYVHLSPEYFTRLFKKETGSNIKDYIMESKIALAKNLLTSSALSVSMVALEVGYTNFSHFTAMFKKHENMTPSEYRLLHARQNT